MGRAKQLMMEQDALRADAAELLKETGAIRECPAHEDILLDEYDPDAVERACKLAEKRIESGEFRLPEWASTSDVFETIREVARETADECGYCQKR